MHYVKDSPLELGHRVWQLRPPTPSLTIVVKGTFDPVDGGPAPFSAEPVPPTGGIHWDDDAEASLRTPSDFALLKPVGECFVVGKAWAPGGRPATTVGCEFQIGPIKKSFAVFGDRKWEGGLVRGVSDAEPFTEMALGMERAYGGAGHSDNPYGRGRDEIEGVVPLPNLEQPRDFVRSTSHAPDPVIVGPLPMTWPDRMRYAGNYEGSYMEERWPWLPEDFDWRFFLESPTDQRLREGFWRGDETVSFEGLHPSQTAVRFTLPEINPRVFLDLHPSGAEPSFTPVPLKLDTVTWDAELGKLLLVWRGLVEVRDEALEDLHHIYVTHDPLDGPERSTAELKARFDGLLQAEADEEEEAEGEDPPEEVEAAPAEGRDTLVSEAPPAPEEADTEAADEVDAQLVALNEKLASLGIARPDPNAEPPTLPELAVLVEALRASGSPVSPELEEAVADVAAHEAPPEEPDTIRIEPEPPPPPEGRALVEARLTAGEPLTGLDLTGSDLSQLDLSQQDLSESILARANLASVNLSGANLNHCNLAEAQLLSANLSAATLSHADLGESNLKWVDFMGALLEDANFDGAVLVQARLANVKAARATFLGSDLSDAVMTSGDFSEADFQGAKLDRVKATEANFTDAILEEATAEAANFDSAVMKQARSEGLFAKDARFGTVNAEDSFWERAELSGADFSFATLTRADFSEAILIGTEMDACTMRGARFDRANAHALKARKADLMEASFTSADLSFADMRGANLFGAELWRAKLDDAQFALANLTRTKLES